MGRGSKEGFTLLELLVVIGIITLLAAITVPVARKLKEGNRMVTCQGHMRTIYQALKIYRLDEQALPFFDPADAFATGAGGPPAAYDPATDGQWRHYGLMKLLDAGYVQSPATLTCPDDVRRDVDGQPYDDATRHERYEVYTREDLDLGEWKYQPYRGESDGSNPDYYRQLVGPTGFLDRNWIPAETTLVLWCDQHTDILSRGGEPQYIALFWDGAVKTKDEVAFTGAPEAWRVAP